MQQRRLRLGDILDDYCPRERRITNHAVVAMIEEKVQQTRCTTCDADHEYKEGKAPTLRRKKPAGALVAEPADGARPRAVLSAVPPMTADPDDEIVLDDSDDDAANGAGAFDGSPLETGPTASLSAIENPIDEDDIPDDEGPVHRPLIRATLPRPEGQVPERKAPDFTMRQPSGRDFGNNRDGGRPMRPAGHGGHGGGQGGQHTRFGGPRHGAGGQPRTPGQGPGGQRDGNRAPAPAAAQHRGARPAAANRGPRPAGGGQGRKRGR
jgi:hypothetical protein